MKFGFVMASVCIIADNFADIVNKILNVADTSCSGEEMASEEEKDRTLNCTITLNRKL